MPSSPRLLLGAVLLLAAVACDAKLNLYGHTETAVMGMAMQLPHDWHIGLWRKLGTPVVGYKFQDNTPESDKSAVRAALSDYEEHTCIRFDEINTFLHIGHHIIFRPSDSECSSYLGRQPMNIFGQDIFLTGDCIADPAYLLHVIGHALGFFYHEENRFDRDDFVDIIASNADSDEYFELSPYGDRTHDVPYDYLSIWHGGPLAHSSNGYTTIRAKNSFAQALMALHRTGLSFMDKLRINRAYKCTDEWLKKCNEASNPCDHLGYLSSSCKCVCPEGTSGSTCSTRTLPYTEALMSSLLHLNEEITEDGTVGSEDDVHPLTEELVFVKVITAPVCKQVQLTFTEFDIAPRCADSSCCEEGLEIRGVEPSSTLAGVWKCGSDVAADDTFVSTDGSLILFYIRESNPGNTRSGFNATVAFEPIAGCRK